MQTSLHGTCGIERDLLAEVGGRRKQQHITTCNHITMLQDVHMWGCITHTLF